MPLLSRLKLIAYNVFLRKKRNTRLERGYLPAAKAPAHRAFEIADAHTGYRDPLDLLLRPDADVGSLLRRARYRSVAMNEFRSLTSKPPNE